MNTLHTFGCSFTGPYETSGSYPAFTEYKKYKGGKFPKIWPELLSERLNLKLNNSAKGGSSNYQIFQSFCDNVEKLRKGDIVIIGWTYKERFRLVNYLSGEFQTIGPGFKTKPLDNISTNTVDEILLNRCHETWVEEIRSWEKIINKLCINLKIQVLFWSFDSDVDESMLNYKLLEIGAETVFIETNGKINDHHFGEQGHKVQCNHFLHLLGKSDKKKLI